MRKIFVILLSLLLLGGCGKKVTISYPEKFVECTKVVMTSTQQMSQDEREKQVEMCSTTLQNLQKDALVRSESRGDRVFQILMALISTAAAVFTASQVGGSK